MLRERLSKRLSVIDQTMRASGQRPSRSSVFSCSASEVSFTDRGESTAGSVVSPTSSEVAEEQWDAVPGLIHDTLQKELVICTKSLSERDRLLQEKDLALELCLRKCDTLDHARESAERKLRREISTLQKEAGTLRTNLHEREEAIKEEKKELKRDIFTLKNQLVQAANRSA
ncbi:hypothetical protein CYMTET_29656 [Cymbomonas tetramitiformis]|uniref:Uncharacterized protein n=1 Tax=Cymbomonas tetramitiformis TaxID=36881 RepID=A0AAE0FKY8_9CHLO|nr:hypothetical protein CYMTET_29656 [Cymbomonas tetramitiformis]